MKRKTSLAISFACLAILAMLAFCPFGTSTTICINGSTTCDGVSPETGPSWIEFLSANLLLGGIAVMIGLSLLPFRRSQRELPLFFRAHVFVPVLFALWVLAGFLFPFSPHQLTHTLPAFLLGANDWGVGNIYTYTKLADWAALLVGCAACAHLANENTTVEQGFIKRLRLCFPHLIAAVAAHFIPAVFECGIHNALAVDNGILFFWLLAGFVVVIALQSLAQGIKEQWSLVVSWLVAFGWLFVPVALSRP